MSDELLARLYIRVDVGSLVCCVCRHARFTADPTHDDHADSCPVPEIAAALRERVAPVEADARMAGIAEWHARMADIERDPQIRQFHTEAAAALRERVAPVEADRYELAVDQFKAQAFCQGLGTLHGNNPDELVAEILTLVRGERVAPVPRPNYDEPCPVCHSDLGPCGHERVAPVEADAYDFKHEATRVCEAIGSNVGNMTVQCALREAFQAGARARVAPVEADAGQTHHEQCPWHSADPTQTRSVCGCPPGWPRVASVEADESKRNRNWPDFPDARSTKR